MRSSHTIKVSEEFVSVQGTGHLVGTTQYFVRLSGCSVRSCPIRHACDEPDSLSSKHGREESVEEIALRAVRSVGRCGWLHVTGGEPLDQLDGIMALGIEAQRLGLRTHYQTSGTIDADFPWDWITVSPKCPPDELRVRFGQEMVIVDTGQSLDDLREYARNTSFWFYYLSPLWGQDPAITIDKVRRLASTQKHWYFTDQSHKHWGVR